MPSAAPKPIVEALSAVMGDVQAVGKKDRNTQQNYNFRGVDAVVNAVGPALRKHGVVVVPVEVTYADERYQTARGAQMRGITATVTFRFYGPAGDYIEAQAAGESSDVGDKAMPKAHSVAFRTLLLEALCIPTDEPDPDTESHERHQNGATSSGPEPKAGAATPVAPVSTPAAQGEAPSGPVITDSQRRRLFAISTANKCPDEEVKAIVKEIAGVDSTKELTTTHYDAVVKAIEDSVPF